MKTRAAHRDELQSLPAIGPSLAPDLRRADRSAQAGAAQVVELEESRIVRSEQAWPFWLVHSSR